MRTLLNTQRSLSVLIKLYTRHILQYRCHLKKVDAHAAGSVQKDEHPILLIFQKIPIHQQTLHMHLSSFLSDVFVIGFRLLLTSVRMSMIHANILAMLMCNFSQANYADTSTSEDEPDEPVAQNKGGSNAVR